jgi:lysyl-tRNA synthetase class 1
MNFFSSASNDSDPAKRVLSVDNEGVELSQLAGEPLLRAELEKVANFFGCQVEVNVDGIEMPREFPTTAGAFDIVRIRKNLEAYLEKNSAHAGALQSALSGHLEPIDTAQVLLHARLFAETLEQKRAALVDILTQYETHEVANDEIDRCVDLFSNLHENKPYFSHKINGAAAFLPRNQPLYALSCFGLVPSYMARTMDVRPPVAMHFFFAKLQKELRVSFFFPNVKLHLGDREEFVEHCGKQFLNPRTDRLEPLVEAVIFTGTMENADDLRQKLDPRTLLIANGAGHNPLVVAPGADLFRAMHSAVRVQLYNQGQDCANPSAILIHKSLLKEFLDRLTAELKSVRVGAYTDERVRVGPITERADLARILQMLVANSEFLDKKAPGVIRVADGIVEPTVIVRPLRHKMGGNYTEQFAPVFFIQEYNTDSDLKSYFDTPQYRKNAMYVTVFGESSYVNNLVNIQVDGRPLHDETTIIRNRDLHEPGVERGTQPYGGYGRGASCYSINGVVTACPTLPQRDIYEQIVVPKLEAIAQAKGADSGNAYSDAS